ncbi:Ulp1 family isopeptidase [Candidatus Berkiella aquae]|uniref:Ubiquitin-like protease family profile domain-containing protein n=1 Tax=Candidatus Berkiella aquae TaxID=295108 RepID=A0A0Q9YIT7_9GAMM|nr:Ulp1 family isopeptidase [Candidatus Berkiella aquae]MCS5712199.1 hypothetical protein [Candidatus Berkiella aquae]
MKNGIKVKKPEVIDITDEDDEISREEYSLIEISDSDEGSELDLVSSEEEAERVEPSSRRPKHTIAIVLEEDDKESAAEKALKLQQHTLTLQYLKKLEMGDTVKKSATLETVRKGYFRVKSLAQEKYSAKDKVKALQQLIALNPDLKDESARRLLKDEWMNTSTIEAFFNLLEEDYSVSVLNSDLAVKPNFCEQLRRKEKIFNAMQVKLQSRRILWPMCDDTHWYLVVINKRTDGRYDLFCLDSLNTKTQDFLDKAVDFLQAMFPEKDLEELVVKKEHIQIPEQDNNRDCGASICFWGERTAKNKTLPRPSKGSCDYSSFRKDIADRFARKIHEDETPVTLSSTRKIRNQ